MAANTPASAHAFSRRQQVAPLPHPSSAGRRFQAIPDRRTKTIPVRAWRSGTGGPPVGDGGRFGINGSTTDQSSSLTRAAMEGLRAYGIHRHGGDGNSGIATASKLFDLGLDVLRFDPLGPPDECQHEQTDDADC